MMIIIYLSKKLVHSMQSLSKNFGIIRVGPIKNISTFYSEAIDYKFESAVLDVICNTNKGFIQNINVF